MLLVRGDGAVRCGAVRCSWLCSASSCALVLMVKDAYANYVVQKLVDVVDDTQRLLIVQRIRQHVPNLRKIPYGKHIISRVEKLTGKAITFAEPSVPSSASSM